MAARRAARRSRRSSRKARRSARRASRRRASRKRVSRRRVARRRVVRRRKARKSIRGTRAQVFRGTRQKVKTTGQTKTDLMKNKRGKIISKKQHAFGKRSYKNIKNWTKAFMQARKNLGIKGFVPCKKGTKFYNECMKIYKK